MLLGRAIVDTPPLGMTGVLGAIALGIGDAYPPVTVLTLLLAWGLYLNKRYQVAVRVCWVPALHSALIVLLLLVFAH
jgi:hypothetical protein